MIKLVLSCAFAAIKTSLSLKKRMRGKKSRRLAFDAFVVFQVAAMKVARTSLDAALGLRVKTYIKIF